MSEYSKTFTGCLEGLDGVRRHFINGAYGRPNDLPSVEHPDGTQCWYIENPKRGGFREPGAVPHREGGPAIVRANGDRYWYHLGKLHRNVAEGPAVELANGTRKWFDQDKCVRCELAPKAGGQ